ncbi:MAG TPA: DUF4251 domain-containing protein [Chitinophagaceae bacterium]|nr:DUF4251 domain-containing protein [Chitinophagaceae bacterium]
MKYSLIAVFMFLMVSAAVAQKKDKEAVKARMAEMVQNETISFRAEMVYPQGRPSRYLSELYYLFTVNDKKVVCDLPYFGEAHQASLANDGGIKFTSSNYTVEKKQLKKGWTMVIKPKDNSDIKECTLNVYESGSANLVVVSNTRSTISYDGRIIEPGSN